MTDFAQSCGPLRLTESRLADGPTKHDLARADAAHSSELAHDHAGGPTATQCSEVTTTPCSDRPSGGQAPAQTTISHKTNADHPARRQARNAPRRRFRSAHLSIIERKTGLARVDSGSVAGRSLDGPVRPRKDTPKRSNGTDTHDVPNTFEPLAGSPRNPPDRRQPSERPTDRNLQVMIRGVNSPARSRSRDQR